MTCAEAHEAMSGLLAGRLGLTEWAELEAHTAACETCDRTLNFRYHDRFEERIERDHSVASRAGRLAKRAGIGVIAVLILGAIGIYAYPRLPEMSVSAWRSLQLPALAGDLLDSLTASARRLASATVPSPAPPAEESRSVVAPEAMPSPSPPSPAPPAEESRSVVAPEAMPSPSPPSPALPAEESRSVVAPGAMPSSPPPTARPAEPSPVASALPAAPASSSAPPSPSATTAPPVPSPPAVADGPPVPSSPAVATRPPASPSATRALPPRSAASPGPVRAPEPKAAAQKPAKERGVAPSPRVQDERPRPLPATHADVVAQLSVQDRQEARRDIGLLLARLGGSRKAERDSTVWLEVPRSRYAEFTRGLAQIGSWQTEQGSSALPDPVAVTVILTR